MGTKISCTRVIAAFLGGVVVGVLILIAAATLSKSDYKMQSNRVYTYGNISCFARPLSDKEYPKTFQAVQVMEVFQDVNRKVSLFLDAKANVTAISFNQNDYSVFDWQENTDNKIMNRVSYGTGKGEIYHDLNVDGQFDLKMLADDAFQVTGRAIFIDGVWKEVEKADFKNGLAKDGSVWYQFADAQWIQVAADEL